MNATPSSRSRMASDEIDLADLLQILWRRRYILITFAVAGLLFAAFYIFKAEEAWTSNSFVTQPRLEQVGAYLEQRRAMARVDGNKPVDVSELTATLFRGFISEAVSMKNRLEFLATTEYFSRRIEGVADLVSQQSLLREGAENLRVTLHDTKQIVPYYELSFTAETAEDAQTVLVEYLAWVNDRSFRLVDESFNDQLSAQILSRQTELANIDFQLRAERQNRIEILENALHTAKLADIKDYVVGRQTEGATVIELSDSRRLFMLGERYLSAELQTAQQAPIIYPPRYYEMLHELEQLEPLRTYDVKTLSYSYMLPPTLPLKRDKPHRLLIIVLGVVAGGMSGMFWVMLAASFQRTGSNGNTLTRTDPLQQL